MPSSYLCYISTWVFLFHLSVARTSKSPEPIVVVPSQDWDGNDGPWSSFIAQIGTPAQTVKLLISTASTQTWAVASEGCGSGDPTDCKKLRGGLFDFNASSTYSPNLANLEGSYYKLGLESNLGYEGNGRFGFDDITLGFPGTGGPMVRNQSVGGIAAKGFFMGVFGLNPRPSNFTEYGDPIPSYLESLRGEEVLGSLSWGYTAGNQYRLNGVLGSLTLGGYDASRFEPNNLTIPFSSQDARDLTVQILNISTGSDQLLSAPLPSYLDSTVPYIYLPEAACIAFERAFGLTWNETSELYLINDTQHALLQLRNPSVVFTLGSLESSTTVDISFPYAAFALTASWPLTPSPTRYFPLKRAANSTQYTLGRTFFQEAYVVADYDRRNFSVSQCTWDARAKQEIVAIEPPRLERAKSTRVPLRAVIGIVIGSVVGIAVILVCIRWMIRRNERMKNVDASIVGSNDHHLFLKPELGCDDVEVRPDKESQEVSTSMCQGPAEVCGRNEVHEIGGPEVAVEVEGLVPPQELFTREQFVELECISRR